MRNSRVSRTDKTEARLGVLVEREPYTDGTGDSEGDLPGIDGGTGHAGEQLGRVGR